MKINVHGHSLYAWVTAAKLSESGHDVVLHTPADVSSDEFNVAKEPGLSLLIEQQRDTARLKLCATPLSQADLYIFAGDYSEASFTETLIPLYASTRGDMHALLLSPLPVGSLTRITQQICDTELAQSHTNTEPRLFLGALPLFIREGCALADFSVPSLFLLGSPHESLTRKAKEVFKTFIEKAKEVMVVPVTAAEMIKFSINAMLATRISFMNEMAALAEKVGVDIELVRQGMSADPRVGRDYLQAGCGFGGPSFSGDLLSLAKKIREELDTDGLIDAVLTINETQKEILFRKLWRFFRGDLSGKKIAIWGAAFKPGTSSVANSVVHPLLQALWAQGCTTVVYDPLACDVLAQNYPDQPHLQLATSAENAAISADALVLVTAWPEFLQQDFGGIRRVMTHPLILDGRNVLNPHALQTLGFRYIGIGRGEVV